MKGLIMYINPYSLDKKYVRVFLHVLCIIQKLKFKKYSDILFDIKGILREFKITFSKGVLMNLLKVIAIMSVIVVSSIHAEDNTEQFITFVKIDGKTCIATNKTEFEQLKSLSDLIDACKQAKAHGTIDSTEYAEKTASYFKDAHSSGLRIHN